MYNEQIDSLVEILNQINRSPTPGKKKKKHALPPLYSPRTRQSSNAWRCRFIWHNLTLAVTEPVLSVGSKHVWRHIRGKIKREKKNLQPEKKCQCGSLPGIFISFEYQTNAIKINIFALKWCFCFVRTAVFRVTPILRCRFVFVPPCALELHFAFLCHSKAHFATLTLDLKSSTNMELVFEPLPILFLTHTQLCLEILWTQLIR